jgi:hypothetical protein
MKLFEKQYYIIFLAVISIVLFWIIIKWGDYLASNPSYFVTPILFENTYKFDFSSAKTCKTVDAFTTQSHSHNVDIPINTRYSCQNTCGPASTCAITGEQCTSDVDCYGCQPIHGVNYAHKVHRSLDGRYVAQMEKPQGDNDSGKLTTEMAPQYSPLTSGYGTQEKQLIDWDSPPPAADFGTNIWFSDYIQEDSLFSSKFKPNANTKFMPHYPRQPTLTGQFQDDGPLPANY